MKRFYLRITYLLLVESAFERRMCDVVVNDSNLEAIVVAIATKDQVEPLDIDVKNIEVQATANVDVEPVNAKKK